MKRGIRLASMVLLAFALLAPADLGAQTKDETVVYALQSDVQTWDPPNSVLRENIILGYNVFDHLAARDLKTGKVGPSLAVSWKSLDDTTWEEFDDLVIQGRSTLDTKRRTEIYAKAQKLIHDDAAYLYKWALRGVWGVSNRVEYEAPRDEVDRMWIVTPRKK